MINYDTDAKNKEWNCINKIEAIDIFQRIL
jgi:hypothetical protein